MRPRNHRLRRMADRAAAFESDRSVAPAGLAWVWVLLVVLTVMEAINELFGIGGPSQIYDVWFHDLAIAVAALLVLGRAVLVPATRRAWMAFGLAMAIWAVGSIAWSLVYSGQPDPPYPTFADVLWLLWYPAMVVGIVYLIQGRVRRFELHRWMDGIAVTLLVLVAGFAVIVQPVADRTSPRLKQSGKKAVEPRTVSGLPCAGNRPYRGSRLLLRLSPSPP